MSVEESSHHSDSNEDEEEESKSKKKYKKSKKKKKKKKKYSSEENTSEEDSKENSDKEDSEDEEEEEESEESEDDEEGYRKKKKKKNKKKKKSKKKDKINKENDNNEEEKEEKKEIKTKDEYLAQIEQLENELQLEQKISDTIGDQIENDEEIINLQNSLGEKNEQLEQLITTNRRQEEALSFLRRQLDKEQDKYKSRNKPKILLSQNFSNPNLNDINKKNYKKIFLSQNDESKKEAINIVLKIKDKAINMAINRMNFYKKENELLKKELYKNEDYTIKLGLVNYSNENKKKIELLNDEIKILNNQLEEHRKCINERNMLNTEYNELKKDLQQIKKNIKEIKDSMKEKQKENLNNGIGNLGNLDTLEDNATNNILSHRSNASKIISSPSIKKQSRNIPLLNLTKSSKSTLLPAILSPTSNYKYDKNILSDEFYSKLKKYYEGRENEYEILIDKIKETENSRNFIENKHKNEIKQFNTQISVLNEQFKILNDEGKGDGSNIRVLKYKLNTAKNEARYCFSQIHKFRNKLDFALRIKRDKEHEIFLLKEQINLLKNKAITKMKKKTDETDSFDSDNSEKPKIIKNNTKINNNKDNISNKKSYNKNNNKINNERDYKNNIIKDNSSKNKKDNNSKNKRTKNDINNNDKKNNSQIDKRDKNINDIITNNNKSKSNINDDKDKNINKIKNIKKGFHSFKKLNLNLNEKKK